MRPIVLDACAGIVAVLFLVSLVAIAVHRSKRNSRSTFQAASVTEYLWAVIPWAMVVACAWPAVWPIVATR